RKVTFDPRCTCCARRMTQMGLQPSTSALSDGRLGARAEALLASAERPVLVQSTDLRRRCDGGRQRAASGYYEADILVCRAAGSCSGPRLGAGTPSRLVSAHRGVYESRWRRAKSNPVKSRTSTSMASATGDSDGTALTPTTEPPPNSSD